MRLTACMVPVSAISGQKPTPDSCKPPDGAAEEVESDPLPEENGTSDDEWNPDKAMAGVYGCPVTLWVLSSLHTFLRG